MLAGGIHETDTVLEPSAGRGALIKAIHRSCPSVTVECYELMPENREFLHTLDNVILLDEDFTKDSVGHYTKIIANPPFSGNQDIDHVRLMYERLEEGGILAAITDQHWKFASEKKCVDFREWLEEVHGEVFEIGAGEFKESGTTVSTMAVVIKSNSKLVMKKMILIYTLLTLIVGCASPRKYKENRFTKQFQEVDSMFNEKYKLHED